MKKNKIVIFLFLLSCLTNCSANRMDSTITEYKGYFKKYCIQDDLFSHFPSKINDNDVYSGMFYPPQADSHFGFVILIMRCKDEDIEIIKKRAALVKDSVLSKKFYTLDVNKDFVPKKRFLYPIVNFEESDWFLGTTEKDIYNSYLGRNIPISIYKYPKDLMVYLIDAKKGYFWTSKLNNNTFDFLKDWKNGYSKGYAVSEDSKLLAYWVIVW